MPQESGIGKLARSVLHICGSTAACMAAAIDPDAYLAGQHDRLLVLTIECEGNQTLDMVGLFNFEQCYQADAKASCIFGWDNLTDWQMVSPLTRWLGTHRSLPKT